jgi:hypothetical protein
MSCLSRAACAVLLATVVLPAQAQTTAAGVWTLGAEARAGWDSSLLADGSDVAGWAYTFTPRVTWTREGTNVNLTAGAGVEFQHFDPDLGQGGAGPFGVVELGWTSLPWSGSVDAALSSSSRVDPLLNRRLRSDRFGVSTDVAYEIGAPWGIAAGAAWTREDAEGAGLGKTDEWSANARVTRALGEGIVAYLGYQVGAADASGDVAADGSADSGFVLAGVDGDIPLRLLPSVTLRARVGYQRRYGRGDGGEAYGGLAGNVAATWAVTPLTEVSVGLTRDLVTALDGAQGTRTAATVGVGHRFTDRIRAGVTASWDRASLGQGVGARGDADTYRLGLGATYALPVGVVLSLDAGTSRTERETSSFDRQFAEAGVSWSY